VRVLVAHSPYLSGAASGENRVVEDEVRLLREAGHHVNLLVPPRTDPRGLARAREGMSAVWSRDAIRQLRRLVRDERPDVLHVHNLFPALSPAVIRAAADRGVPVVATLHAYRLLCLPATFLRGGEICELCLGRTPWRGVVHRCYRGSAPASASLATSLVAHRLLGSFDRVGLYLAVGEFLRSKHVEAGLPAERVVVKPNFAWESAQRQGPGEYFLFLGRLSPEKGGDDLLAAWRDVGAPLLVVGDGPEGARLRRAAPATVEFRGQVSAAEALGLLLRARALVLPARSYEGCPRSVLEAFAAGVPVLASGIGGIPELVEPGLSGLTFPPRDPRAIAHAAHALLDDAEAERLGRGARGLWEERFSPERALAGLERAYARALGR
jgi:glycosyltransferase involved in cell wall biosynthesis